MEETNRLCQRPAAPGWARPIQGTISCEYSGVYVSIVGVALDHDGSVEINHAVAWDRHRYWASTVETTPSGVT